TTCDDHGRPVVVCPWADALRVVMTSRNTRRRQTIMTIALRYRSGAFGPPTDNTVTRAKRLSQLCNNDGPWLCARNRGRRIETDDRERPAIASVVTIAKVRTLSRQAKALRLASPGADREN